jgi:hypothetical protein
MKEIDSFFIGIVVGGASVAAALAFLFGAPQISQAGATIVAAIVALIAAMLTYRAAFAKVHYDKWRDEQDRAERKRTVIVKLLYGVRECAHILAAVRANLPKVADDPCVIYEKTKIIKVPDSLQKTWESAGALSIPVADAMGELFERFHDIDGLNWKLERAIDSGGILAPEFSNRFIFIIIESLSRLSAIEKSIEVELDAMDVSRALARQQRAWFD